MFTQHNGLKFVEPAIVLFKLIKSVYRETVVGPFHFENSGFRVLSDALGGCSDRFANGRNIIAGRLKFQDRPMAVLGVVDPEVL